MQSWLLNEFAMTRGNLVSSFMILYHFNVHVMLDYLEVNADDIKFKVMLKNIQPL